MLHTRLQVRACYTGRNMYLMKCYSLSYYSNNGKEPKKEEERAPKSGRNKTSRNKKEWWGQGTGFCSLYGNVSA